MGDKGKGRRDLGEGTSKRHEEEKAGLPPNPRELEKERQFQQLLEEIINNDKIVELENEITKAENKKEKVYNKTRKEIIKRDKTLNPDEFTEEADIIIKEIQLEKEINKDDDVIDANKKYNEATKNLLNYLKGRRQFVVNELTKKRIAYEEQIKKLNKQIDKLDENKSGDQKLIAKRTALKKTRTNTINNYYQNIEAHTLAIKSLNNNILELIEESHQNDLDKMPQHVGLHASGFEIHTPRAITGRTIPIATESRTAIIEQRDELLRMMEEEEEKLMNEILATYHRLDPTKQIRAKREFKAQRHRILKKIMKDHQQEIQRTGLMKPGAQIPLSDPMIKQELARIGMEKLPKHPTVEQIERARNELDRAQDGIASSLDAIQKKEQNIIARSTKLNEKQKEIQDKENKIKKREQELAGRESEIEAQAEVFTKAQGKDATRALDKLSAENGELVAKLEKAKQQNLGKEDDNKKIRENLNNCQEDLKKCRKNLKKCESQNKELNNRIRELEGKEVEEVAWYEAVIKWFKDLFGGEEEPKDRKGKGKRRTKGGTLEDTREELFTLLNNIETDMRGGRLSNKHNLARIGGRRRSKSRSSSSDMGQKDLNTLLGYYQGPQSLYRSSLEKEFGKSKRKSRTKSKRKSKRSRSKSRTKSKRKGKRSRSKSRSKYMSRRASSRHIRAPPYDQHEFLPGLNL